MFMGYYIMVMDVFMILAIIMQMFGADVNNKMVTRRRKKYTFPLEVNHTDRT